MKLTRMFRARITDQIFRQWQDVLALQAAIDRAKGRSPRCRAARVLRVMLTNQRRNQKLALDALGIDHIEVLNEARSRRGDIDDEPFKGPPVNLPRILD
jgi:hypothetical protein